jgi:colanic acid biosynthesis glycosyl transferase WcaI
VPDEPLLSRRLRLPVVPPEPTTLPAAFAHGLKEAGWNVRVLTGFPNYPSGKVREGYENRFPQKEWQ